MHDTLKKFFWVCITLFPASSFLTAMPENSIPHDTLSINISENKDTITETISNKMFKKSVGYSAFKREQSLDREDRYTLLEKGVSSLGFRLTFGGGGTTDDWLLTIIEIEERKKFNIGVGLTGNYFFKDNTSVGLRLGYNYRHYELQMDGKIFELVMDSRNYKMGNASDSYSATGFIRNYIPLGQLQRFFFINETNLYYSYTHSLVRDVYDKGKDIRKVERGIHDAGIGLTLGVMYFLSRGFAFEFSLSPLVAYFEYTKVTVNEVDPGNNNDWGLNFRFIPNGVHLGFTYYFGLDYEKYNKAMRKLNL